MTKVSRSSVSMHGTWSVPFLGKTTQAFFGPTR
jgi:hypothetical protein